MARRRMIDPNIWQSEDFAKLSKLAKLVFMGLFSNADDEGKGRANPTYLKSILFPYDDKLRTTDIIESLKEIGTYTSIVFYTHNESQYYKLENWNKWQTIDKPKKSTIPDPSECIGDASANDRRSIGDASANDRQPIDDASRLKERKGKEEKEKGKEGECMPGAQAAPGRSPAISLPLNDGNDYPVYHEQIEKWVKLYPSVDVMQELRKMAGWLDSNPSRRKTKNGIKRFITGWLAREQDKGGKANERVLGSVGAGPGARYGTDI